MAEKVTSSRDPEATSAPARRPRNPRTRVVPADPRVPASSRKVVLAKGTDPFLGRVPEGMEPHIRRIIESRTPPPAEETGEAAPQQITEAVAPSQAEGSAQPGKRTRRASAKELAAKKAAEERRATTAAAQVEAVKSGQAGRVRSKAGAEAEESIAMEAYKATPVNPRITLSEATPESPITEMDIDLMRMGINPDFPPSEMSPKRAMFGRELFLTPPAGKVAELEKGIASTKEGSVRRETFKGRLDRLTRTAITNTARRIEEGYDVHPAVAEEGRAEIRRLYRQGIAAPSASDTRRASTTIIPRRRRTTILSAESAGEPITVPHVGMAGLSADQIREVQKGLVYERALGSAMGMDYSTGSAEALLDPEPSTYVRNASDIPRVKPNQFLEEFEVRRTSPSGEVLPGAQEIYNAQQSSRARRRGVIAQNREADEYNTAIEYQNRQNAATAAVAEERGVQPPTPIPPMPTKRVPTAISGRTMGVPEVDELSFPDTASRLRYLADLNKSSGTPEAPSVVAPRSLTSNKDLRGTEELAAVPSSQSKGMGKNYGIQRATKFYPTTSGSDVVHYKIPGGADRLTQDMNRMSAQMGMSPSPEQIRHLQKIGEIASIMRGNRPSAISPFRQRQAAGDYSDAEHSKATAALADLTTQLSEHKVAMTLTRTGAPTAAGRAKLSELEGLHAQAKARVSGIELLRTRDAQDAAMAADRRVLPSGTKGMYQRQAGMGQYGRVKPVSMQMAEESAARQQRQEQLSNTIFSRGDIAHGLRSQLTNPFSNSSMGGEGIKSLNTIVEVAPESASYLHDAAIQGLHTAYANAYGVSLGTRQPRSTVQTVDQALRDVGTVREAIGRTSHFAAGTLSESGQQLPPRRQ